MYDSVYLYEFNINPVDYNNIYESVVDFNTKKLIASAVPVRKTSNKEVKNLINTLLNYKNYKTQGIYDSYACYTPKFSFIFYKKQKIVSVVDICLKCNKVAVLFNDSEGIHGNYYTFYEKGKINFTELCKYYNLSHCK